MSETATVRNSQGFAMVHPAPDGSLQLTVARDGDGVGTTIIGLTRESAAIIGRALTGTPAPFLEDARFEDVQVGDRVRITWKDGDVIECTVGKVTGYRIDSESGEVVVVERDNNHLTILSRPTPQLPTEPGAVILVDFSWGTVAATRTTQQSWRFYDSDGDSRLYDDDTIGRHTWKPAKVVEV